ncbi:membrane protein insertase YidC [Parasaccharibacter sp. TMW 2.1884]|uniref:membrane protein insertase YidC n=1 Tax=Parasaccharibacter sp. TMW 2.1884 TaxID=2267834 RepID=UPI002012702E|nr:membrane protein insertase YidC [Parasaccharibacter sp. TMW 2.1884]MCL1511071.1 membrane protein insertase YidC [Parasaccharibacter sp. TMW 2.1884]
MESSKRIILAVILSAMILIGFNIFLPPDRHKPVEDQGSAPAPASAVQQPALASPAPAGPMDEADDHQEHRLKVTSSDVQGSFNLRGARLDDLELTRYRETIAKDSPLVRLLDRAGGAQPTYLVIGWENAAGFTTRLPNGHSLWQVDGEQTSLTPESPVSLHWDNGAGVRFLIHLEQDHHYMVTVRQEVENHSGQPVSVYPFQRVQRDYLPEDTGSFTAYEGPIAVMNGRLADKGYKSLRTDGTGPDHVSWTDAGKGGWGGITDKYWLTAVGADASANVRIRYSYLPEEHGSYRVTFTSQEPQVIQDGARLGQGSYLFAGAKEPGLLRYYGRKLGLPRFDDSIDFGWFSFLTKPILFLLHWLYAHIGNFGLGLMAMTLIVKIVLFPLASKAAQSSARMRMIAPKVTEIREKYKNDPATMNQKVMAMYKEEKINPAGGCLPMLIQAPIFFCLYKMLNLSIDERHAPFFGWIKDLSVPDPTNLFNLFGLLPFDPTHIFSFLHLSIWGAALGITFWLLQKHSMVSMDPAQARIMQFMPIVYVFVMSSFPAGLLVYYTWNNVLTFLQQHYIERRTSLPVPLIGRKGKAPRKGGEKKKGS